MELLGYLNYETPVTYDENYFINSTDIYFSYDEDKSLLNISNGGDGSRIHIQLKEKTTSRYIFSITIIETANYYQNVASGNVEIYYNQDGIEKILVNGVEGGYLEDKYQDCFNISPDRYLHILYNRQN
jgi:hypothetical protein